jgi:hypothetical protein
MRVFKNKWFTRWARKEHVSDNILFEAAQEIVAGKVEADLGGSLFKKRLPRSGGGKRGGYRIIVGYRKPNSERIIFLYAFDKKDKGTISDDEAAAFSLVAEDIISASDRQVSKLLMEDFMTEVHYNE